MCHLPISTVMNDANDSGMPLCLNRPGNGLIELAAFEHLATLVSRELFLLPYRNKEKLLISFEGKDVLFDLSTLHLSLDQAQSLVVRIFSDTSALQLKLSPSELRRRDPKTGEILESEDFQVGDASGSEQSPIIQKSTSRQRRLHTESVEKKGKYGFSVMWGDGDKLIYSSLCVAKAAGGRVDG